MSTRNTSGTPSDDRLINLSGMYEDYFLDYASYVILERAVPAIEDGLKPVQRRILHAMKEMDDGRFHKVANIIGQTMQYHPHGDAAIGDALVNLGQKNLLIDCQGNWGDVRTGDPSAASRYIEARLTKFALEVVFNSQTTQWQRSYDGRKNEPVTLPVKFPLLLVQGAEGIAVGLSTKILPHNFIELIQASIKILQGKSVKIYPDFETGGYVDVSDYQDGKRGGRIKVRAKIESVDKNNLVIRELPYGITTTQLIDSIIKANEKGKIKIKRIVDNTAQHVELGIELASGVSPEVTIDALYAFTNCEVSIAPNACVIIEQKPHFMTVEEILRIATDNTRELLRQELLIKLHELNEKWHYASLEKIFIENRVYHEIEEAESWEQVLVIIDREMRKYISTPSDNAGKSDKRLRLSREFTNEDIIRLTEIKIKRISKYNKFKTDELLTNIEAEIKEVQHHLDNLTDFAIDYYKNLLEKYGKGRERKTQITEFDQIAASTVAANNAKLFVNRQDGFIGFGLKKDEFVTDCSDIDDVIVFRADGNFSVTRIAEKTFAGKDIIHVDVWNKGDNRTTYNMVYTDKETGISYVKRFHVTSITRDKDYQLGASGNSKVLYFTANPNGEAEVIQVQLSQGAKARVKMFDFDFADLAIKGRNSKGNRLTKYPVRKVSQKELGKSTLGALKVWMDEVSGRLNTDGRGHYIGEFDTGDKIITLFKDGSYALTDLDMNAKMDVDNVLEIRKFNPNLVVSAIYFEGEKQWTLVKRFGIETSSTGQKFSFITDNKSSKLYGATLNENPIALVSYKEKNTKTEEKVNLAEFIDIKGWKALGNRLRDGKLLSVKWVDNEEKVSDEEDKASSNGKNHNYKAGDTIEFDF
jgi:topoisomerase IV subunit A